MNANFLGQIGQFLPIIIILVVFVVLIIIPQRKRDKKAKEMMAGLRVGDNIKTIGGIYGKIVALKDDLVTIESGPDKCKIVFAKGAIASVESADVELDDSLPDVK